MIVEEKEISIIYSFWVLLSKFGISSTYNALYLSNTRLFPTYFCATAFGISNVVSKLVTVSSPIVAELKGQLPLMLFFSTCTIASISTLVLKIN